MILQRGKPMNDLTATAKRATSLLGSQPSPSSALTELHEEIDRADGSAQGIVESCDFD